MPTAKELYTLRRKKEKLKIAKHADTTEVVEAYPLMIHAFPKISFFVNRVPWDTGRIGSVRPWLVSERRTGRRLGVVGSTIKRAVLSVVEGNYDYNQEDMIKYIRITEKINDPLP